MARRSGPERRQDDRHHLVVALQHAQQRGVEAAGGVIVGGGGELVVEAETVQERRAGGRCCARRNCRGCRTGRGCGSAAGRDSAPAVSRFGTLSGTLRSPSMSSLKAIRRDGQAGQHGEGVAHPGGARDLAEGADVRQAGGAVAGLEQRLALARLCPAGRRPWRLPRTATPSAARRRCCEVFRTSAASYGTRRSSRLVNPAGHPPIVAAPCQRRLPRRHARGPRRMPAMPPTRPALVGGARPRRDPDRRRRAAAACPADEAAATCGRWTRRCWCMRRRRCAGSGCARMPCLDLLELFAFVLPARAAAPTPRGLALALDLDAAGRRAGGRGRAAAGAGRAAAARGWRPGGTWR